MNKELAFRIVKCVDYDIAKDLKFNDPDGLIQIAKDIRAVIADHEIPLDALHEAMGGKL